MAFTRDQSLTSESGQIYDSWHVEICSHKSVEFALPERQFVLIMTSAILYLKVFNTNELSFYTYLDDIGEGKSSNYRVQCESEFRHSFQLHKPNTN